MCLLKSPPGVPQQFKKDVFHFQAKRQCKDVYIVEDPARGFIMNQGFPMSYVKTGDKESAYKFFIHPIKDNIYLRTIDDEDVALSIVGGDNFAHNGSFVGLYVFINDKYPEFNFQQFRFYYDGTISPKKKKLLVLCENDQNQIILCERTDLKRRLTF